MENQYSNFIYWIALILPSVIAGTVAVISLITNYKTSKSNQLHNMTFTQKEKVADQYIEKSSELIALTDPLVLNAKINEFTPTLITHDEFLQIMQRLLDIDNRVQTLSSIIKLHTWSIYEDVALPEVSNMFTTIDAVQTHIQSMLMSLIKLHSTNTEQGHFRDSTPMESKQMLERTFSETYREPYISMVVSITNVAKILRKEALGKKR